MKLKSGHTIKAEVRSRFFHFLSFLCLLFHKMHIRSLGRIVSICWTVGDLSEAITQWGCEDPKSDPGGTQSRTHILLFLWGMGDVG